MKACARHVASLLAQLKPGVRHIVAMDHVESVRPTCGRTCCRGCLTVACGLRGAQVAHFVVDAALQGARDVDTARGTASPTHGVANSDPAVLHLFVFLRDALLSEEDVPQQRAQGATQPSAQPSAQE